MMTIDRIIAMMVLGHIIADFPLQCVGGRMNLSSLKQRRVWEAMFQHSLPKRYRFDYVACLACHSLMWSIAVSLPLIDSVVFTPSVVCNAVIHGVVDDLKANRGCISLVVDQLLHAAQIAVTAWLFCVCGGVNG